MSRKVLGAQHTFIHKLKDDFGVRFISLSKSCPEIGKVVIGDGDVGVEE
jgi:adenosine/AMP kinase